MSILKNAIRVPWMKGGLNPWIWFDVMGMILTTTSPSEHTWLGILATVQSTGRRLNLHTGWTYRPPWRLALNLHYCGYLRFHFLSVPQMVHKPFAWMMTEECDKSHNRTYVHCLSTFCYFMPPMHVVYWLCIDIVFYAVLQMLFVWTVS